MDLDEYQQKATETTQFDLSGEDGKYIAIMGLSGEVGELATEYKKKLRDGGGYTIFKEKLTEEIGDILWYLSAIAYHEKLTLGEIAQANLLKINDRWKEGVSKTLQSDNLFFDNSFDENEQLPRVFSVEFKEIVCEDKNKYISITWDGENFGDPLRDNAYDTDFYRFHDVFHFSYAVVLGWSPIARKLFKRKRKSAPKIDEIEDGGRAGVIDEAISSLIFEYAKKHSFFEKPCGVDYSLLRTIKELTQHLEVSARTCKDWETAILLGFDNWRKLKEFNGGTIHCNLNERTMIYQEIKLK
jgi:NTP pyrophosphatase (non-canonical NTP hydrolase)